jgi:hypothetical protein
MKAMILLEATKASEAEDFEGQTEMMEEMGYCYKSSDLASYHPRKSIKNP